MNEKLTSEIKDVFKAHPKEDELLVTSDGHVFLKSARNLAADHAFRNGGKVETVSRESILSVDGPQTSETDKSLEEMTIAEVKGWASSETDIESLERALTSVQSKGGKEAIEARIQEIKSAE